MSELEYLSACPLCWLIAAWKNYDGIEAIVQTRGVSEYNLMNELYYRGIEVVL